MAPLLDMKEEVMDPGHRKWWPLLSCLLVLLALVGYATKMDTTEDRFAAGLLAISVFVDLAIVADQGRKSRLARDLGWCELPKLIFLFVYAYNEGAGKNRLSDLAANLWAWAALVAALIVTFVMVFVAADVIRKAPAKRIPADIRELLTDKVLALAGVLIAFLQVTYFLAFALAFSDGASARQLFATNDGALPTPAPPPHAKPAEVPRCPAPFDGRVRKFFFSESTASLLCTLSLEAAARRNEKLRAAVCENGVESVVDAFKDVPAPACDARPNSAWERRAAALNLRELYALRSVFRTLECKPDGCSYLVEVRGHANDTALKKAPVLAYGSNYEISKQRADQIALLLNEAVQQSTGAGGAALRWLSYGVSTEDSFLDEEPRNWLDAKPLDRKLSVEVRILPVADSFENRHLRAAHIERRTLDLLDYVYFTVYTITTTGYGDIRPVGGYAKFVVTIANLIELLFVVVIFNLIANTRPENGSKDGHPSSTGENHASGA